MPWYLPVHGSVFCEELRRRLRGSRSFLVLFIYGVTLLVLLIGAHQLTNIGEPSQWPEFGKKLWRIFLLGQLAIVVLISPGITASAVSAEREGKTLEHVFLTPLSTLAFVAGKYFGAVGQLLLVILAGLPIVAIVFYYGGVSPWEVLLGYALILACGLLYAALGFLASSLLARTTFAVVWAYGFMLVALVGMPVFMLFAAYINPLLTLNDTSWLFSCSPLLLLDTERGVNLDASTTVGQLWGMLAWTAGLLAISTLQIRRLRGIGPFVYRRVSLAVARRRSRLAGL